VWAWQVCILPMVENQLCYTSGLTATTSDRRLSIALNKEFVKHKAWCAHNQEWSQTLSLLWNGNSLKSAKIWCFVWNCPFSQICSHMTGLTGHSSKCQDIKLFECDMWSDVSPMNKVWLQRFVSLLCDSAELCAPNVGVCVWMKE